MNMIEAAIKNYYGERCPDHDADCVVCQAWREFDIVWNSIDEAMLKLTGEEL